MSEVLASFKHNTYYGSVHGIYVMSLEDWKKIKFIQGEGVDLYLGEVAGKHSDVESSFDNFVLVSSDAKEIDTFKNLFGKTFGSYIPFDMAMETYDEITYESEEEDVEY